LVLLAPSINIKFNVLFDCTCFVNVTVNHWMCRRCQWRRSGFSSWRQHCWTGKNKTVCYCHVNVI